MHRIWNGVLPRYWVESPWWADCDGDLILLVPTEEGRVLQRLRSNGTAVWERSVVSSLLVCCEHGVIITARVQDRRSDAVYFQFTALSAKTGELLWELPTDLVVAQPKGGVPHFPIQPDREVLVRLDKWRRIVDGRPVEHATPSPLRGEWRYCSTVVSEGPEGLTIKSGGHQWADSTLRLRDVLGVAGDFLIGTDTSSIWSRMLSTGQQVWRVEFDAQGVVVPSDRVAGLEAECWSFASTVPVAAVLHNDQMLVLQESSVGTSVVSWPSQSVLETWPTTGAVVLMGLVGEHVLALEEYEDGMGYLWLVR